MTPKNTVAVVLLAAMAGTWWWVLSGTTAPASLAARPPGGQAVAAGTVPPRVMLERLERVPPSPRPSGRDPFASRAVATASAGGEAAATSVWSAAATATAAPEPPRWPRLSLIGVSRRATDAGVDRVAILSGERGIVHARAGDHVAQVYRVDRVDDDLVEMMLLPEQRTITLRLR